MSFNASACLDQIYNGVVGVGDPDISGIGVILAFILSAYITIATILGAYIFGLVDDSLLRPVDKLIMRVPARAAKHPKVHITLRKAVMVLSDQQIVTGIAILGAGFQRLQQGVISVYHFHIVIYLAWMSSSVHLSALTLLRPWLISHRGVLAWRIIGMLVLFFMLLISLVPTVSNDWAVVTVQDDWTPSTAMVFGVPALCFWGKTYGDGVNPDAIISFLVLFVSYVWKAGGLFLPVRNAFESYFRNPLDCILETPLSMLAKSYRFSGRRKYLWGFRLWLVIYLMITSFLEVLGSFTAALWLSVLGLIYGTMQIVIPRLLVAYFNPSIKQQETEWGFGQLVPLILLVQPLGACTELLWLIGEDDEEVFQERESTEPPKQSLQWFQAGRRLAQSSNEPLIHTMAHYVVPSRTEQAPQRMHLKAILYNTRLFALLIWFVQAAVAGTSVAVFWIDSGSIGWTQAESWYYISVAIGSYLVGSALLILSLAPHSRLGRSKHDPEIVAWKMVRSWSYWSTRSSPSLPSDLNN